MSTVRSRQQKTATSKTKKNRPARKAPKRVPANPTGGPSKGSLKTADKPRREEASQANGGGRGSPLEAALRGGADPQVVACLGKALQARAGEPEALTVVQELAMLLREKHNPSVVECLARDLARGADAGVIGALAGYLKAGLAPNQIGAVAYFFPRKQLLRSGPVQEARKC